MTTSHPANRRFRQLIDTHKFSYQNSKRRDEKTKITCDLVDKLLSEGRFILFDPKTKLWHEVSEEYAREKVSHSLRSRSSSYERNSVTRHTTSVVNDNFGIEDEANGISEHQISTNTIAPTFITCTTNNAVADLPMDINALPSSSTTKATNTLSRDMINANDNDKIKTSVHRFNNKTSKHPPPHHRSTTHSLKRQHSGSQYNTIDVHNRTIVDMVNRSVVDVVSGTTPNTVVDDQYTATDLGQQQERGGNGRGGGGGMGSRSSSCASFEKDEYNNNNNTNNEKHTDLENNSNTNTNTTNNYDRRVSGMSRGTGGTGNDSQRSFRGLLPSQFSTVRSSFQRRNSRSQSQQQSQTQQEDYDDKFLDVCRLDEARSKLIGKVEEPNMIKLLSHWTGTILNEVIYDVVFWLTLAMYVALRIWIQIGAQHYVKEYEEDTYDPHTQYEGGHTTNTNTTTTTTMAGTTGDSIPTAAATVVVTDLETYESKAKVLDSLPIVGGFLTLFLVFFVNQNHERYYSLHDSTMHIMGRICNLSSLLASSPFLPIERARRINRYCNAAHVVMYAGLTRYLQEGQLVHNLCRDYALLTYEETLRMEVCGLYKGKASACFELLTWALMDVNRALHANCIDQHQASEMRQHIVDFRSMVAQIVVTCLCPIPFFYVHFLSLLTAIYLPLFALMVAFKTGSHAESVPWYAEVVGFFLILLQCLFVVGLRILGQQLGNPYGEDFIDIQITTYIIMVLSTSNRILECTEVNDIDGDVDPDIELGLKLQMVNLGDSWGIKQSNNSLISSQQPSNTITAQTASPSQSRSSSSRSLYAATAVPTSTTHDDQQHRYSSSSSNSNSNNDDDDATIEFIQEDIEDQTYIDTHHPSSELRQRSNIPKTKEKFLDKIKRLRHEVKSESSSSEKNKVSRTMPLSYSMHRCIPPPNEILR